MYDFMTPTCKLISAPEQTSKLMTHMVKPKLRLMLFVTAIGICFESFLTLFLAETKPPAVPLS